jgi:hypothetical protein
MEAQTRTPQFNTMNNMIHQEPPALAHRNWQILKRCRHFGHAIFAGVSRDGEYVHLATAITGMDTRSKNRRYMRDGTFCEIKTQIVDPSLETGDPELAPYATQAQMHDGKFAISNGRQTWDALAYEPRPTLLGDALSKYEYEPDAPIFTNRITARCRLISNSTGVISPIFEFATHSPTEFGTTWISSTKPEILENGYSLFLATHDGGENPPNRFAGGPRLIKTERISNLNRLVTDLSIGHDFLVAVSLKIIRIQNGAVKTIEIWNRKDDE